MSDVYRTLRLQRLGSIVIVQPYEGDKMAGQSLTCDLRTGTVALAEHHPIERDYTTIFGILGLFRMHKSTVFVVIDKAEEVGQLRGAAVHKVTAVRLLASLTTDEDYDQTLLRLLESAVNPKVNGRTMYFSYGADITQTTQRAAALAASKEEASKPLALRADPRFFWNKALLAPLLDGRAGMARFALPIMLGFFEQLPNVSFRVLGSEKPATFTLIARRGVARAGTRYWRRGADLQGNVANFVESEQLLTFADHNVASSYVQVRGSLPILWSQAPNIKYKPPTLMAPPEASAPAFTKHADKLLEAYKHVTALNLVNQHGSEGRLALQLQELSSAYAATHSGFRLVSFDFHKECGATNYARLDNLWQQVQGDFDQFGYYVSTSKGVKQQQGIFRTNCVDSLDRTNVVQGMLARKQLEAQLRKLDALPPNETLTSYYPEFEFKFRNIWADHGDEISLQYAGTGALKSQFTRTGKRDVRGLLDDGYKSAVRYLLNNFADGAKQDGMDIITASYKPEPGKPVKFVHQPFVLYPVIIAFMLFYFTLANWARLEESGLDGVDYVLGFGRGVLLPLVIGAFVLGAVFRFGNRFVKRPYLCPRQVEVWLNKD